MIRAFTLLSLGLIAFSASSAAYAARNVVFLNNPSLSDVQRVDNFVVKSTGKPFFSDLVLFAANIDGTDPNSPVLSYNEQMSTVLDDNLDSIKQLQKNGIKVQIAYLGNHQNAGWSCTMTQQTTTKLADAMVKDVVKYGLDGIDIDDEYSKCSGDAVSFYDLIKAIKAHPSFAGKTLSKALWTDSQYFESPVNAADHLSEGYEMTYAGSVSYLQPYVDYGMKKSALFLGISPEFTDASDTKAIAASVAKGGYAGVMIWAPNAHLSDTATAAKFYTQIIKGQNGASASVIYKP